MDTSNEVVNISVIHKRKLRFKSFFLFSIPLLLSLPHLSHLSSEINYGDTLENIKIEDEL